MTDLETYFKMRKALKLATEWIGKVPVQFLSPELRQEGYRVQLSITTALLISHANTIDVEQTPLLLMEKTEGTE